MPSKSGVRERMVEFVKKHPGCTRRELIQKLGRPVNDSMPSYCMRHGFIFAAGAKHWTRYYPTAEMAAEATETVNAAAERQKRERERRLRRIWNIKMRAKRALKGQTLRTTRPGQMTVELDPGTIISPQVKITIAPPMRDRWAA